MYGINVGNSSLFYINPWAMIQISLLEISFIQNGIITKGSVRLKDMMTVIVFVMNEFLKPRYLRASSKFLFYITI